MKPAIVGRDGDGTPYSPTYLDVYHSRDGAILQCRHVFLAGNGLPARWARRRSFTVVETGFGLGLNFLVTWHAWRNDRERCERLHFVSVEKHPLASDDLSTLHARHPGLADEAARLRAAWPPIVPGMHRLHFDDGRVTLTLVFADALAGLAQMRCAADAFFLDGFAPDRNPDMWSPRLMKQCARLASEDATAATYTAAGSVREALRAAGFEVSRQAGCGRKRHMLAARRCAAPAASAASHAGERRALVVGAGLAGAAVAERLAARGWHITVIERLPEPAGATSAVHAAAIHPHVSRDDCTLSRLARNGFLYGIARWQALSDAGHALAHGACGVAQPACDDAQAIDMEQTMGAHGYPEAYASYVARDALGAYCGVRLARGGYWYPLGGWIQPASLVRAQLDQARAAVLCRSHVERLERVNGCWHALAADGDVIAEAPVVVLASAGDAARLADVAHPLKRVRGQLTHLPAAAYPGLRAVIAGDGHLLPAVGGIVVAGSTYGTDGEERGLTAASHERNLAALRRLVPGTCVSTAAPCGGFVGFRTYAADRLPLIGALPDIAAIRAQFDRLRGPHLADMPRLPGLYGAFGYGSRGLTWAALAGELLAASIEGEPLPLEGALADAVDPARMAMKRLRHRDLP